MFGLTTKELKVTEEASSYLREQLNDNMAGIRLMIVSGKGCSGNEYDMKPILKGDELPEDDVLEIDSDLKLFIPKSDVLRFFGSTIDYKPDSLGSRRIQIINPNESSRCGCGESVGF